jgi:hypothetical protein
MSFFFNIDSKYERKYMVFLFESGLFLLTLWSQIPSIFLQVTWFHSTFFGGTGVRTQGFTLAKQVLTPWASTLAQFHSPLWLNNIPLCIYQLSILRAICYCSSVLTGHLDVTFPYRDGGLCGTDTDFWAMTELKLQ